MTSKLPPLPVGVTPGSGYWNDWYEKLRTLINSITTGVSWSLVTGTPTSLAGYGITDPVQLTTSKDTASGYAGLNTVSRTTKGVDTTDDIITDSTTKGTVMKSPNGHYWRAAISNLGVVTWTDLGTTKP
jgi:hypothetical protein